MIFLKNAPSLLLFMSFADNIQSKRYLEAIISLRVANNLNNLHLRTYSTRVSNLYVE